MEEFLERLFYYHTVELPLSGETKEYIERLLSIWYECEMNGRTFQEWLEDNEMKEEFKKFKDGIYWTNNL